MRYAALGDSMSIDVYAGGAGRGAASLLHRNRDIDFPDWSGRDLHTRGYELLDLSYDGATTGGVLAQQLPRLERPDLVTITIGGNDLMGAYGDTAGAEAVIRTVAERSDAILDGVTATFRGPRRVVVSTVYDPSDGTGAVPSGLPPWPDGPRLVRRLNARLTDLADRHGAVVADLHAHFLGHGAKAGDPGQPHPRPDNRDLWYCGVIEPNAWGAAEIRRVWWLAIEEAGWLS
jgi:lysophospholipase L1-like esterase